MFGLNRLPRWMTPSMLVLVISNLMVLYGLLHLGWGVFALIFLFWMENVIIGAFNILKMLFNRPHNTVNWFGKLFVIPFFTFHYGMFAAVHGIFVLVLFGPESLKEQIGSPFEFWRYLNVIESEQLGYMVAFLIFSHGFSFVVNYIFKDEYKRLNLGDLMNTPYGRVVILHITLLTSGFVLMALGSPLIGLIILLGLKIVFDAWAHYREHKKWERLGTTEDESASP